MKHKIYLFAALLMAIFVPQSVTAQNNYDFSAVAPSGQTLYYNIVDGHAEVVNPFTGSYVSGNLVIPSTVTYNGDTYNVTVLYGTFQGCFGLTSVSIPNSITSIGESAFRGCSGLTTVTIPNSVTAIGNEAFSGCSGLTTVTIPNAVISIGESAFSECSGLTSLTIPNSVTAIGNEAFSGCSGLTSITVESGNVVYDSRENCNAIIETSTNTLITGCMNTIIPNSVTSIDSYAFSGCSGLTSVTIPNSVTSIGNGAFSGCSGLTSVTIPNSVTSIRNSTFRYCSGLASVTIPNSVTSIGNIAFSGCSGLASVTIPNSVTSIGSNAFSYCSGLTEITCFVSTAPFLYSNVFNGVTNTIPVNIPYCSTNSYQSGWSYFNNFIESVAVTEFCVITSSEQTLHYTINDDSTSVRLDGHKNDISGALTIPSEVTFCGHTYTVTSISERAFMDCSGLTSVTIPNSVNSIGNRAFLLCSGLTEVTIPNAVTSISDSAFSYCIGLTSVTIPNSVISIGESAFGNCYALTSVSIGNSVTEIGYAAFAGCYDLTSVTFGSSVTEIGGYSFYNSNLTDITCLGSTAPSLGPYVFYPYYTYTVNIPCGSLSSYQSSWSFDFNFIENFPYTLNVQSADTVFGTATVTTAPTCSNNTAIVAAIPNDGYHFTGWSDSNTDNPRTLTVSDDVSITAIFEQNIYTITATTTDGGSTTGSGTYTHGSTVTLTAIAEKNHLFLGWNDGTDSNPYTFTATTDKNVSALFSPIIHDTVVDTIIVTPSCPPPDTIIVVEHDTTTVNIHDTTYMAVHDTTIVNVIMYDTTYIDVPYPVYDTTIVNTYQYDTTVVNVSVYDTIIVNTYQYDTSIYNNFRYDTTLVYDTMVVNVYTYDTSIYNNYRYDTVILNTYQYDTTLVNIYDTVINNIYQYDTMVINITVYDTTIVNNYQYDTVIVNNYYYDTVYVNNYTHDTVTNYYHDTVNNYFYDTVIITNTYHDTVIVNNYIYDTIYLNRYIFDTIYIHDTVFVTETEGVGGVETTSAKIYQRGGHIVVESGDGYVELPEVTVYDAVGRQMVTSTERLPVYRFDVPVSGVYLVKIGDYPARRIVVIK